MAEDTLSGQRVMVVEDEYLIADDVRHALETAGATVLGPVPSVKAALDLLGSATSPNAVVLDLNLGGTMAYSVADALASQGVPFLFTTGYDQAALPERHAAVRRLQKPVEAALIVREVGRLVAAR